MDKLRADSFLYKVRLVAEYYRFPRQVETLQSQVRLLLETSVSFHCRALCKLVSLRSRIRNYEVLVRELSCRCAQHNKQPRVSLYSVSTNYLTQNLALIC